MPDDNTSKVAPQRKTVRKTQRKPKSAAPAFAADKLSRPSDELQDMNFKVRNNFRRTFKVMAAVHGMSMKELLEASFNAWLEKHGLPPLPED